MINRKFMSMLIMAFMLMLTACGPNDTVRLTYPEKDSSVLPAPSAATVAVVLFTDKRPHAHLGVRRNNTTFASTVAVPEWISRSFADALSRHGLQVSYAESVDVARKAQPQYIVTGTVNLAELQEISITELRSTMQVDVILSNSQGRLINESLSASQNITGIIIESTAEKLLRQTVQELIKPGVQKITQTINKK